MYRTAPASESKKPSNGTSTATLLRFQVVTAMSTRTNAAAFTANTPLTPNNGISKPPSAGPMIPDRFI